MSKTLFPAPDSYPGHEMAQLTTNDNKPIAVVWVSAFPNNPEVVQWANRDYAYKKDPLGYGSLVYAQLETPYVPKTIHIGEMPRTFHVERKTL